jgi:PspA-Associated protein
MIVRILGEGQMDVDALRLDELNKLDNELLEALEHGDEAQFQQRLNALLEAVRRGSSPVADDHIAPSELILPHPDATIDEVRELLSDDGLIPG